MASLKIKAKRSNMSYGKILTSCISGVLLALSNATHAQDAMPVREYSELEESLRYEELLAEFGENKTLPEGFELQALLALSHYPALRSTRINFIVDDVSIPLSSRPHWGSMLRSAANRSYQVIIDTEREGTREALLLKNQPFNAQVGIIGHELAHTVYYLDRSFFGILGDALCQLSDCRINFERETDKRLIEHGLGWQRLEHATFVRGQIAGDNVSAFTAEGGGGAYMSPAEILGILQAHPAYSE